MSKPDPLDPKNAKTTAFQISEDELNARMEKQRKMHDEPLEKAAQVLESAICQVVSKLGVDTTKDDDSIHFQMDFLGIYINTLEGYPGIFVNLDKGTDIEPFAWISDAILKSDGVYHYEIHWFKEDAMKEIKGDKILQ
jgi:hypothetical protein